MLVQQSTQQRPIVWTIAGSDCGGGAGIQADIKTFEDFAVHGCSVVTAVTAQNTQQLTAVNAVEVEVLSAQLQSLYEDFKPKAIKIGMLANANIIACVSEFLLKIKKQNEKLFICCDPVLTASAGGNLFDKGAKNIFIAKLLPLVDLLTPNISELAFLSESKINSEQSLVQAAKSCLAFGVDSVFIKGGHADFFSEKKLFSNDFFMADKSDLLLTAPSQFYLSCERTAQSAHGTGCRLASAITALVTQQKSLEDALALAKAYVHKGLQTSYVAGSTQRQIASQKNISIENLPQVFFESERINREAFLSCDNLGLYPVVDDVAWLEKILPLGIKTIQLRLKDKSEEEINSQIQQAVKLQKKYGAQLFINDYWQQAIAHGAYGVHLGQSDLENADVDAIQKAGLRLGISTHGWWEIARAHALQPSYIAIGPIFPTTTKEMPFAEQGIAQLAQWVDLLSVHYPVVAIGGINIERAPAVMKTGVSSIAVVSAITQAKDYQQACTELMQIVNSARI